MNTAVIFGKATDEYETPQALFDALDVEFCFGLDAAATLENAKTPEFYDAESDALTRRWAGFGAVWLNPPYSKCRAFMTKAAHEARDGCTVVCLVPARTDTRWFHEWVWDREKHQPRPGVEVRFVKGRLKFGSSQNSAPFPSVVIVFRPVR